MTDNASKTFSSRISAQTDPAAANAHAEAEAAGRLLDAIADIVAARDAEGRIVYVNAAFRRAFGGHAEYWRGRRLNFAPRRTIAGGQGRRRIDIEVETVAGWACFEWEETPLPGGGSIGVGRDVSARRANEAALRHAREAAEISARTRETLFATITHELRTPAIGVLGMADLLRGTELSPEQNAYVTAISDSGRHLLTLVDDVLDAAKLEAGAFTLEPVEVDLADLLRSVAELVSPRARSKGLETVVYLDPRAPKTVHADAARLRQILLNLAGNAVKFTAQGAVAIIVDCLEESEAEAELVLRVRDTGPGVPEADRQRIFEAFAQTEGARASGVEGTGLGLAIVKRLVGAMDGEVGLTAPASGGSEFWVRLSVPVIEPAPAHETKRLEGARVLVVANQPLAAEMTARQLSAFGAQAEMCAGWDELQAALARDADRVALIDASIAHSEAPDARAALVLAAPDQRGELQAFLKAGYAGWIVKPFRPDALVAHTLRAWRGEALSEPHEADEVLEPEHDASAPAAAGVRVLLVEDNPVNRVLAQTVLKRVHADVVTAETGPAAVDAAAAARRLDLILMDMRLPGFDGLEATRRIRELPGPAGQTPILALTANCSEEDRRACLEAGMSDFLAKPLDADALSSALARWTQLAKPGHAPGV